MKCGKSSCVFGGFYVPTPGTYVKSSKYIYVCKSLHFIPVMDLSVLQSFRVFIHIWLSDLCFLVLLTKQFFFKSTSTVFFRFNEPAPTFAFFVLHAFLFLSTKQLFSKVQVNSFFRFIEPAPTFARLNLFFKDARDQLILTDKLCGTQCSTLLP
jgi:hypothetical protein